MKLNTKLRWAKKLFLKLETNSAGPLYFTDGNPDPFESKDKAYAEDKAGIAWFPVSQARKIAKSLGLELEVF